MQKISENNIDLIITDPPYGIEYQSNQREEKFEKLKNDDGLEWFGRFVEIADNVLKQDSAFYCFTRYDVYPKMYRELQKYFEINDLLVIPSRHSSMGDLEQSFESRFELCIYCSKGKVEFNKVKMIRESKSSYWDSRNKNTDGWKYRPPALLEDFYATESNHELIHPTQKSLELIRYFVKLHSDKGDTVLDPFAGSGTTCLAAKQLGRNYVGIELENEYVKKCNKRLEKQSKRIDSFTKSSQESLSLTDKHKKGGED